VPWRKLSIHWSLANDDVRMTSLYFETGAVEDEEDAVEAAFDTEWASLKGLWDADTALVEYRWYFSATFVPRSGNWGDHARSIARSVPGTAVGNQLPPQLAVVVGYPRDSPYRRHPGRNYLPAPATTTLDATGRISNAAATQIGDRWTLFLRACEVIGYMPRTITRIQGVDGALPIDKVRVDNVWDTQRRRGFEDATFTYTVVV
jgi:hypothetical protein